MISGKGGTGKTTMAALIIGILAQRKSGTVLAVDADPNSNLAEALGVAKVGTIADIIDQVGSKPDVVPVGMGKDSFIEYQIHKEISENEGFDLLVMGRPEGPGCYCYINNVLRNCIAKLVKSYDFIVIDNEAGMEHFSRKTTRACSELFVISDETAVGLKSAKRILDLTEELGIIAKRRFLIVNKTKSLNTLKLKKDFSIDKAFSIPLDKKISLLNTKGRSLVGLNKSSKAWTALKQLGDEIWPMN